MRHFTIATVALFFLAVIESRVAAWNAIGHMTVAKIAYDELDGKTQLALFNVLKKHPHYSDFLAASKPENVDNEVQWVILRSAVWPDWIRAIKKDGRGININIYHRPEHHYINVPLIDPVDVDFFAGKTLISPDLPNIVTALKHRSNEVKLKNTGSQDRAIAVCWLFHLVGDIHQPLHNVAYFSKAPAFQKGDLGGNIFAIKADGRKWKLHQFWDDVLGEDSDYNDDSANHQGRLYAQAVKLGESLRGSHLSAANLEKLAKNVTIESWSRESYELARTVGYQKADGSGLLKAVPIGFKMPIPEDAEEVGKEYIQRARATAETQAVLAGKRLAARVTALLRP